MRAFFILGSQGSLALAELQALLPTLQVTFASDDVVIADVEQPNLTALQDRSGGLIKSGYVYASVKTTSEVPQALSDLVTSMRVGADKVQFGISIYSGGHRGKHMALRTQLERIGLQTKTHIKQTRPVRFVTSTASVLSSVVVTKQRLIHDGIEFCLFAREDGIDIGITETVQDFEEWSTRDYHRPARDAKRGMLPPKLARMMLNVSGVDASGTILDPFCGVGTVLTEAMKIGWTTLVGSDADATAIEATRTNVLWESARQQVTPDLQLFQTRAESIGTFLAPASVDACVAELYLGRPQTGDETTGELKQRLEALDTMYAPSLRGLASVLRAGASVVLAAPAYVRPSGTLTSRLPELAPLFGLRAVPWPKEVDVTPQGAVRYIRPDQWVGRDVYRFSAEER